MLTRPSLSPHRYQGTTKQLASLLAEMAVQGKVSNDNGTYRFRRATPTAARPGSPVPARAASPAARAPSPSAARATSPAAAAMDPAAAPMAQYEPAVLDLLQNYAGLTVERLQSLLQNSPKARG